MKRARMLLLPVAVLTLTVAAFQNCGSAHSTAELEKLTADSMSFFGYPYKSRPPFYVNVALFRPASAGAGDLSRFKFLGSVAYLSRSEVGVNYNVAILDENGATLCPAQSGVLVGGISSITFDCVTARKSDRVRVRLDVVADGEHSVVERLF